MLDLLTSLADKSLVITETTGDSTRYRLLETVRQYARERLVESGEENAIRVRHLDYFLKLAIEIRPNLFGPEQEHWSEVLAAEHDNARQALTFCQKEDKKGEEGLRLGAALRPFWYLHGHYREGGERLAALLAHPRVQEPTMARANALHDAGLLAHMQGNYTEARSLNEKSLTIFRELGDKQGIANALLDLGNVDRDQGDYVAARSLYEESLTLQRELGNKHGIAECLDGFTSLAVHEKKRQVSVRLWGASMALREALGSPLPPHERQRQESDFVGIEQALGQPAFMVALDEGRAMTLEQATAYALETAEG